PVPLRPQERMDMSVGGREAEADDLTAVVQRRWCAVRAAERAEIDWDKEDLAGRNCASGNRREDCRDQRRPAAGIRTHWRPKVSQQRLQTTHRAPLPGRIEICGAAKWT